MWQFNTGRFDLTEFSFCGLMSFLSLWWRDTSENGADKIYASLFLDFFDRSTTYTQLEIGKDGE